MELQVFDPQNGNSYHLSLSLSPNKDVIIIRQVHITEQLVKLLGKKLSSGENFMSGPVV